VTVVYILNRSPTKALNDKMSYEAWHGRKQTVYHLRVFGCLAFSKELDHIGKIDDTRAVELRMDCKSALALAKNPIFYERSKRTG
jgi:hypothetical protein